MRYNDNQIETEVITDVATEPVSLADVKRALNLQFDSEGSYEFNDDDTLLLDLIARCRAYIEEYTGLSLAPKTLKSVLRNELGGVEIPYGPVTEVTTLVDGDGGAVIPTYYGNQFKTILSPCLCNLVVTYTAGYAAGKCPTGLRSAIIEEVVFRYNNRGDQQQEYASSSVALCESALNLAAPYKRKSMLV